MSDKIDQRIVEMSFENQKFEKGISQSKNSLKEFANALDKSGLDKEYSGLEKSVTSLSNSFSMLEQIGIGALRRIGEAAVDAGAKMIKHLTIDPLIAGWTKYEQKTASVQTIMNATGKSIDEVNGYLDKLMWFSDETSYGFTDMTAALAQMTSSGGDIDALIPLITGVANATAYAGKGATEFSRAMYNLNQSYGAGNLQYMDWRSLELAGVAGKDLKQIFIDTGKALGTLDKNGRTAKGTLVDIGTFGTTLQEKWANTKVMEAAFGKFSELSEAAYELVNNGTYDTAAEAMEFLAGKYSLVAEKGFKAAQEAKSFSEAINATMDAVSSGWMRTYELIFGQLDEATKNFTALTEILWTVFASGAEARNEMLSWLKAAGGVSNVFQGIKNVAVALLTILLPVSKAIDQIFPPTTKEQWLAITESFKNFTESLIITEESADKIRRTFAGLFAVVDIGWQVLKFLGSAALEVVKVFVPLGDGFLGATASLGDLLVKINQAIKSSGIFQYGLLAVKVGVALLRDGISKLVKGVSEFISGLWNAENPLEYLKDAGGRVFSGLIDGVKMVVSWFSGKFTKSIKSVSKLFGEVGDEADTSVWGTILKVLKEVVTFIGGEAVDGFQSFGDVVKNLDFHKIATFVVGGMLLMFVKQLSDLTGAMTGFTTAVTGTINGLNQKLFGIKPSLIRDIALALGVLAASIWVLSTIPAEELSKSLIGLAEAVAIFVVAYGLIQTINVVASKSMNNTKMISSAFGLTGIAAALLIMAIAVKTISKIDTAQVWNATAVLAAMLGLLTVYQVLTALISAIPNQKKVSSNLFGMSVAILTLVGALAILNHFSLTDISSSLGKLTGILLVVGVLEGVFALAGRIGGGNKVSMSILGMAAGIIAMLAVMKILSNIDMSTLTQGITNLARIAVLIAGIELMMGLAGRIGGGKKFQNSIFAVSIGLLALVALIAILGTMTQDTIDRGIINLAKMSGIIVGIELLTALAARISGGAKVQKILGAVTITLLAFAGVIKILGNMLPEEIDQGFLVLSKMVGLIGIIEIMTAATSKMSGGVKLSASLLGAVAAVATLAGALALLSVIDQPSLRNASISLAIASVAIVALSFAMDKISGAANLMSKGSAGFIGKVKNIGLTLVALGGLLIATAAFFGVLGLVLPIVKNVKPEDLGTFIVGIGAITALLVVLDRIPMSNGFGQRLLGLIPGFVAMALVVGATWAFFKVLNDVLPIIKNVEWADLGKFIVGIGALTILMGAMLLLAVPLTMLGGTIMATGGLALVGMLIGLVTVLAALGIVVVAVAGLSLLLNKILPSADTLTRGLDLLVLVGAGIGRFIGAFAGGLAGGVLEGIGTSLAGFVNSLSGFSPESLIGIKALAEAILIITAASLVDGIASFVTGKSSMDVFGKQLSGLITAIKAIPAEDVTAASATLAAMVPMATNLKAFAETAQLIPPSGGLVQAIMGNTTVEEFGKQLAGLVTAFKDVTAVNATAASDVLAAMIPMITNLEKFITLAEKIPPSGGLVQAIMGNTTTDEFGAQLAGLVTAFKDVTAVNATAASDVLAAMIPMITNLEKFITLAEKIPPSGGLVQAIMGNTTTDEFGAQLSGLASAFKDINITDVQTASDVLSLMTKENGMLSALTKFSDFSNGLKASGGLAQIGSGNTTLSEFGNEFKKFVGTMADIDFSVVAPAMTAMSNLNTTLGTFGANVLDNATKSFENNKAPFQASIASIIDEPTKKIESQKKVLVDSVTAVFKAVTDNGPTYVAAFKTLGGNIVEGLKAGIVAKQPSAVTTIKTIMGDIVVAANKVVQTGSPSKVFTTIGSWCTIGLANGISKKTDAAVLAATNMAEATEEAVRDSLGVHSESKPFFGIGAWLPKSLGSGMASGKTWVLDTAKNLGIDTGNVTTSGIMSGLTNREGALTTTVNSLLGILTGTTTPAATATGSDLAKATTAGYNKSMSSNTTGLAATATETVKAELEKIKAIIEEREFYGKITVDEELAMYQELRAKYKEGSEERKQIDREIYARLKTIYDAQVSYIDGVKKAQADAAADIEKLETEHIEEVAKAKADAAKKLADLDAKYTDDSEKAKLDANKKIESEDKSYYKSLGSLLESAEEDRKRLREEYASDQKSINSKLLSDIDTQNKAYETAVKSRADAIYNSYNLFAAVEPDVEVTGSELLKNLQDQGAALSEWKQSLAALEGRGVGAGLIDELQAMGPASKAQINALLTLTDEQLTEYVGLFEGKYTFARVKAEEELEGLKNSTATAIQGLNAQAAIDLGTLESEFAVSMTNINDKMATDMAELLTTHNETMTEINTDLLEKLTELQTTWSKSTSEINTDLAENLSEMQTTYDTALTKINTDLQTNLREMKSKFASTMKEISGLSEAELLKLIADNESQLGHLNAVVNAKLGDVENTVGASGTTMVSLFGETFEEIVPNTVATVGTLGAKVDGALNPVESTFWQSGLYAASGFARGIYDNSYQGVNAAAYLARAAVTAANKILDVGSPSKVFAEIGMFVSTGFANGIVKYAGQAKKASEEMASGPIAAVSSALASMEESNDWSFTITPVLDLSAVRASDITQLLNKPINLGRTSSKLAAEVVQNGSREAAPVTSIVNKFDLTGLTVRKEDDIDRIATKLYQKQQTASRGYGVRAPIRA